jgi:hypothetical protein
MKLLLAMTFLVASAVGIHFSGVDLLNGFQEKKAFSKKVSVVKPKFLREKIKETEMPVYTFFEILNDPTMTQYVGLDGKVVPAQPQLKNISVVSAKEKVALPPAEKILKSDLLEKPVIKQDKNVETPSTERPSRYAVQVGSFRDAGRAGVLKMKLKKNGFDAFLMQTQIADDAWHRVFMGRYVNEQEAQAAAIMARSNFKLNAVVVSKTN